MPSCHFYHKNRKFLPCLLLAGVLWKCDSGWHSKYERAVRHSSYCKEPVRWPSNKQDQYPSHPALASVQEILGSQIKSQPFSLLSLTDIAIGGREHQILLLTPFRTESSLSDNPMPSSLWITFRQLLQSPCSHSAIVAGGSRIFPFKNSLHKDRAGTEFSGMI